LQLLLQLLLLLIVCAYAVVGNFIVVGKLNLFSHQNQQQQQQH
jgi:hypothetical protein